MKIIVGLGNPGKKYENTRHNVGFLALDRLAEKKEISAVGEKLEFIKNKKFNSIVASTENKGEKVILVKPETYMNSSGEAVLKIMQYYKADISDLIVIYDDVDIPLGQIRLRLEGSSAGHNGMQSIIDLLGTDQFIRVRIGISDESKNMQEIDEKENQIDTKDYVLSQFSDREIKMVDKVTDEAAELIVRCLGKKEEFKATTIELR
jgi:PTH1 family peptidyl-tRNA hydrolase